MSCLIVFKAVLDFHYLIQLSDASRQKGSKSDPLLRNVQNKVLLKLNLLQFWFASFTFCFTLVAIILKTIINITFSMLHIGDQEKDTNLLVSVVYNDL